MNNSDNINDQETLPPPAPKPVGFATLSPERRREISSKGGKAAQASGRSHRFTPEEARAAGQKGGRICHERRGHRMSPRPQ